MTKPIKVEDIVGDKSNPDVKITIDTQEVVGHGRAVKVLFEPQSDRGIEALGKMTDIQVFAASRAVIDDLIVHIEGGESS